MRKVSAAFRPKAFVFDLEGTLVDHKCRQAKIVEEALASQGIKLRFKISSIYFLRSFPEFHDKRDFFKAVLALNRQKSAIKILANASSAEAVKRIRRAINKLPAGGNEILESAVEKYSELRRNPSIYEELQKTIKGVCKMLEELHRKGVKIAVVSNANEAQAKALVEKHGLKLFIDVLVFDNGIIPKKPHPASILEAASALNVDVDDCVVVDDSVAGIEAGKRAGAALTVGVLTGNSTRKMLESSKPNLIIGSVGNLLKRLKISEIKCR